MHDVNSHTDVAAGVTRRMMIASAMMLLFMSVLLPAQTAEDEAYRRAIAYEKGGDMEGAAELFAELFAKDPISRVFFDGVVRTYSALGRYEELRDIVERRIDEGDEGIKTRLLFAELLYRSGDRSGAMTTWKGALESSTKDHTTFTMIAESFLRVGLMSEAIRTYEEALRHSGRSFELHRKLGDLYLSVGEIAKGVNEYIGILDQEPARVPDVISLLSANLSAATDFRAAVEVARHHVEVNRNDVPFRRVLIWLLIEAGDETEALTQTEELDRRRDAKGSELYAFGDRMRRAGRFGLSIDAFDRLMKASDTSHPLYGSALLGIAHATMQMLHDNDEASDEDWAELIEKFRAVGERSRSTSTRLEAIEAIARIEAYERGRHDVALALLDTLTLPMTIGETMTIVRMKADIRLLSGDLAGAVVEYRRFIEESGAIGHGGSEHVSESRLRLAELYLFEGKIDEGIDSLKSLVADPTSGAMNDAMEWLMIVEDNRSNGDTLLVDYLHGMVAVRRSEWKEVDRLMSLVYESDRKSTLADDALYYRALSLLARRRQAEGYEILERIATEHATGTHADRALIEWAKGLEEEGKREEAERIYRKLLTEYPSSIEAGRARDGLRRVGSEGL